MKNKPLWLNIGSGVHLLKNFVNVDPFMSLADLKKGIKTKKGWYQNAKIEPGATFCKASITALPQKTGTVDYIESCAMLEHLSLAEVVPALTEVRRVLKSGGTAIITTPDFTGGAKSWLEFEAADHLDIDRYVYLSQLTYGNQVGPGEYHRVPFSPRVLGYMLLTAGWDLDKEVKMTLYPTNSVHPKLKSGRGKGQFFINDTIVMELTKK